MKQRKWLQFTLAAAMTLSPAAFGGVIGNPGPGQGGGPPETIKPVRVQVEWSQAAAKPFNSQPINLMVIVTDYKTGVTIPNLSQAEFHFKFIEYGCLSLIGAEISSFNNPGTGAYQIQLKPKPMGGCGYWQGQGTENHSVEVTVYSPSSPINPVAQLGITALRIEVL